MWSPSQIAFSGLRDDVPGSSHVPEAYDATSGAGFPPFRAVDGSGREAGGEGWHASPRCGGGGLHSLERSLRHNKLPRGQCGKSSRRWHMLQSLHVAAL